MSFITSFFAAFWTMAKRYPQTMMSSWIEPTMSEQVQAGRYVDMYFIMGQALATLMEKQDWSLADLQEYMKKEDIKYRKEKAS